MDNLSTMLSKHLKDQGYTLEKEYCGYPEKRYVLRFMGEFVASALDKKELVLTAILHDDERTIKIL